MVQRDKKLRIEDYYDAERNEITDFPPPSEDFFFEGAPHRQPDEERQQTS